MYESVLKLCLVTKPNIGPLPAYLSFLEQAIAGGVTCVQLRDKTTSKPSLLERAKAIKSHLDAYQIPLIINDDVDLALAINAQGVHLGQNDLHPFKARSLLGHDKLIGLSIETPTQLEHANQLKSIDYVAISAVFPTRNKNDCKTIWGLNGLKTMVQKTKYPVIAIGGITLENAMDVIATGVSGIAVISAIHEHEDPKIAARALIHSFK